MREKWEIFQNVAHKILQIMKNYIIVADTSNLRFEKIKL